MSVLIVCPQAVGAAWAKQIALWQQGGFKPWDHQVKAALWASVRRASMMAMDMGTGKTLTALLALDYAFGLERLMPLVLVEGSTKSRAAEMQQAMMRDPTARAMVVVNYDSVWRGELGKAVAKHKWSAIILDESHRAKSPGGKASRWLASLARANPNARLMCLTGTPMPHSPLDLYGQFRFLDPAVFGTSFARYRARYAETDFKFPSKVKKWIRQDELTAKLNQHAWRIAADDVLSLPEAIHETIDVTLSPKCRKFYKELERDMVAALEQGTVTTSNALTRLLRLQQATSGYAAIDEADSTSPMLIDGSPSKRLALTDWMQDLPIAEPVVVFCRFRCDLQEVGAVARELGRQYAELSGARNELAAWQAGNADVLGVQLQSGGVGIDLTRAAYCVYYSMGYSLGDYEQSLARLRRPGQTRCCRYYHLVCKDTVDEQVYAALKQRRSVVDSVLQGLTERVQ